MEQLAGKHELMLGQVCIFCAVTGTQRAVKFLRSSRFNFRVFTRVRVVVLIANISLVVCLTEVIS
jgi:hypothetical protein